MAEKDLGKTSTGIKPNVSALLCYLLGFITGIVFLLIEKENKFVRFHAMQSIVTFGALFVICWIVPFLPYIRVVLLPILFIGELALWIILMIKGYQGEKFKLPVVGDFAEKNI